MTIFEAYNSTKIKLQKAGIEDYVFEAKQIIMHITGLNALQIMNNYNRPLTEFQQNNLTAILHQREVRYPLQYILGTWEFYGRPFWVGPGVLIPRADTECVVEEAMEQLKTAESPCILDLCAGSGAIGITLAKELPESRVTMVEKHPEALRYAQKNLETNLAENATAKLGDIFNADGSDGEYDLVVSNPPYISESQRNILSPEVKFEPESALFAQDDGLEFYKEIIKNYKDCLKIGGAMVFEVGFQQADAVMQLFEENNFKNIRTRKDLNGINRAVSAIKTEE